MTITAPTTPASPAQIALIVRLLAERDVPDDLSASITSLVDSNDLG